jgi:hypothetical protein
MGGKFEFISIVDFGATIGTFSPQMLNALWYTDVIMSGVFFWSGV